MFTLGYQNARIGFFAAASWLGACYAVAADAPAPVKIAVFPFELEDFSPARKGDEAPHLERSMQEAVKQLTDSGRYTVVDTAGADLSIAKGQPLRECGGCEAAIARQLGADQAMIGVVAKISNTEYLVKLQISDAQSGKVVSSLASELRMGADYSWSRGVRWVIQNRLLAAPEMTETPSQPPGD